MERFDEFISKIENPDHQAKMKEILTWIKNKFPNLVAEVKWNQPMFIDHGTYIIGFSVAKQHIAVAPEHAGISQFADIIKQSGYDSTQGMFRITWSSPVDYQLLEKIIEFNITDKANCVTFWR